MMSSVSATDQTATIERNMLPRRARRVPATGARDFAQMRARSVRTPFEIRTPPSVA
jgi:hypothetical protein